MRNRARTLAKILPVLALSLRGQTCPELVPPPEDPKNLFSQIQEVHLGDAAAEQLGRQFEVIEDAGLTRYLADVGRRLVSVFPPTGFRFRFYLMDHPDTNAYSFPGGRIYLSRRLIAFLEDESELAAVLAHELGHIHARQGAGRLSEALREVLEVERLGDRDDVFQKYNLFLENRRRVAKAGLKSLLDKHQVEADRLGLVALAAAGYDPEVSPKLFDRLAQLKGRTGGWLSEFFGLSGPQENRLREAIRSVGKLPPACLGAPMAPAPAVFRIWKAAVVASQ